MARAGYCDQCRENVWLSPDGSCSRGHSSEHVSGAYETEPVQPVQPAQYPQPAQHPQPGGYPQPQAPPSYAPQPQPRQDRSGLVVVVVAMLLIGFVFICGILTAIAIPIFNAARASAQQKACYANQRTLETAIQTYKTEHEQPPANLDQLVSDGTIARVPVCPSGGSWLYDPAAGEVSCDRHGAFGQSPNAPPTE